MKLAIAMLVCAALMPVSLRSMVVAMAFMSVPKRIWFRKVW